MSLRSILLSMLLYLAAGGALAAGDLSKIAWLTGCWEGQGLGGQISECWVRSEDNTYTAVFQLQHDNKLSFTEIVALADFDGQPAMRVRHFNPDFSQWDSDKGSYVSFPLLSADHQRAQFEGLEYRLDAGRLHISLDMNRADGSVSTQRFTLHRVPRPRPPHEPKTHRPAS